MNTSLRLKTLMIPYFKQSAFTKQPSIIGVLLIPDFLSYRQRLYFNNLSVDSQKKGPALCVFNSARFWLTEQ